MMDTARIFLNVVPAIAMIGLVPLVPSDYLLTLIYIGIIIGALFIKKEK